MTQHLHMLQLQPTQFHNLIWASNEAVDWLYFTSLGIEFQRILPLKTLGFNPFRIVLALGSCSRSYALRSLVISFLINRSHLNAGFFLAI